MYYKEKRVMSQRASIQDLIGTLKSGTDLESRPVRIRYTESTEVKSGNFMRLTFPRIADDMLDCRSVRLKFNLNLPANQFIDSRDIRSIFNRVRIVSGSTVLFDLSSASQYFNIENAIKTDVNDTGMSRYLTGNVDLTTRTEYPASREYICTVTPENCLLNSDSLLPLSRMSSLHLELYLENASAVNYAEFALVGQSFSISNVEMLCTYIRSSSLSSYFNSNALSFHTVDISSRYSTILSQKHLCRLSSSHTSLTRILTVLKRMSLANNKASNDRFTTFYSGEHVLSYNLLKNSTRHFEVDVDSVEQAFLHLQDCFPDVKTAEYFTALYRTDRHIIAVNLQSAPSAFNDVLVSGIKTSSLNTDITLELTLDAAPTESIVAESFLFSDAIISLSATGGDLQIRY